MFGWKMYEFHPTTWRGTKNKERTLLFLSFLDSCTMPQHAAATDGWQVLRPDEEPICENGRKKNDRKPLDIQNGSKIDSMKAMTWNECKSDSTFNIVWFFSDNMYVFFIVGMDTVMHSYPRNKIENNNSKPIQNVIWNHYSPFERNKARYTSCNGFYSLPIALAQAHWPKLLNGAPSGACTSICWCWHGMSDWRWHLSFIHRWLSHCHNWTVIEFARRLLNKSFPRTTQSDIKVLAHIRTSQQFIRHSPPKWSSVVVGWCFCCCRQ